MTAEVGWIVPEEEIVTILESALAAVPADLPDLVDRVYFNLAPEKRAQIVTWWREHRPRVLHGYPHFEIELPCIAVVIDPEQQVQQYSGDAAYNLQLATGEHVIVAAERWRPTLGVICYAENGDVARWLYAFAKFALARARRALADLFPHSQQLSGRDLAPEAFPQGGRWRYRRVLQVVVEHDQFDVQPDDLGDIADVVNVIGVTDGPGDGVN